MRYAGSSILTAQDINFSPIILYLSIDKEAVDYDIIVGKLESLITKTNIM